MVRLLPVSRSEQVGENDARAEFGRMSKTPTCLEGGGRAVQQKLPEQRRGSGQVVGGRAEQEGDQSTREE